MLVSHDQNLLQSVCHQVSFSLPFQPKPVFVVIFLFSPAAVLEITAYMHRAGFAKVGQLKLRREVSMSTKEKWKRLLLRPNRISFRCVLCASP